MTPSEKVIRVLLLLLGRPFRYTKKELAKYLGFEKDAITGAFKAIIAADIKIESNKYHQYAIVPRENFKELKHLQPLTDVEQFELARLIEKHMKAGDARYLTKKLESLYDFQRLGLRALRRPALERIDNLEAAKKQKLQVMLKNYSSNSNSIGDRLVEVFHIDPEIDMVQGYDVEKRDNRHFRLSRIKRVEILDMPWAFTSSHNVKPTDIFGIANNVQEQVDLKLDVYARNLLIETHPLAKASIDTGSDDCSFYFSCKVNKEFLGLRNFIMANWDHVEILYPDSLKEYILKDTERFLEKLKQAQGVG